jgi:hypothetical protein
MARDAVDYQTNQYQGDDPHEKHNILLFYISRISVVIKDSVKTRQRVIEDFVSANCLKLK